MNANQLVEVLKAWAHPGLSPRQWIQVGPSSTGGRAAVVCNVFDEHIEVVYLDDRNRPINEDVIWDGAAWQFKHQGPCGGYADNYDRLSEYIAVLRRGPW
jgi:hypothetical protein